MTIIGELSLWVALILSVWSTVVSFAGGALRREDLTESGVRGLYAAFAMILLAAIGLWTALLSRDFSLEYVAGHISQDTPGVYAFTAFWSGGAGKLLFWALALSACASIAVAFGVRRDRELVPWTTGTVSAILLFIVATACIEANPFGRLDVTPLDGHGMDPRLQNPAMAVHQPSLIIGYAATALPFALAIAVLCTRRIDAEWLGVVRRWTLLSWLFLTIGIVLGMRWAYVIPSAGASWTWRPVQTSSLLPWLGIAASVHSIDAQATRHLLRKWTVVLVQLTFILSIFAAFIARGGQIESGPSSARSPNEAWFSAFFFLTTGMAVYLIGTRLRETESAADLESAIRGRGRIGGYTMHAGVVIVLVALAGLSFRRQYDAMLKTGESYQAADPFGHVWRFVSQGVSQFDRADHVVAILALDAYRDGKRVGLITAEQRTYRDILGNQLFEPSTHAGLHSTAMLDTYVVPLDLRREKGSDVAELHVEFNPLVGWVWAGGLVMVIGGMIALWPRADRKAAQTGDVAA